MSNITKIREALTGPCGSVAQYSVGWRWLMIHLSRINKPRYQRIVMQNIKANHNKSGIKWSKPKNWMDLHK